MVIEPSRAFDVVPSGRLMAGIALVHFRAGLPSDRRRHHREVIHGVAEWRLMALRALAGTRRWMAKFGDRPLNDRTALRAVSAEQTLVTILGRVATDAIERRLVVFERS